MRFSHVLGAAEIVLSLAGGFYFGGREWAKGVACLFFAVLLHTRADRLIKKENLEFVRMRDRLSDAFILSGITLGIGRYYVYGLFALACALILPQIAGRAREFIGSENRDAKRKYRLFVILMAGIAQLRYPNALVLGVIAVTVMVVLDFVGTIKGLKLAKPKKARKM